MTQVTVRDLNVFPVKGCQANPRREVRITTAGLEGDRRFALVEDGMTIDQGENPGLARFSLAWEGEDHLVISHPEAGRYDHRPHTDGQLAEARSYFEEIPTRDQGDEVAAWISAAIGKPVRLVSAGGTWQPSIPLEEFAAVDGQTKDAFWAAAPVSVANQSSLDDLNARLAEPVPMDRFRMNVVLEGLEAHLENDVKFLATKEVILERVTVCERCVITTTDQNAGAM